MTLRALCLLRPDGLSRLRLMLLSIADHDVTVVAEPSPMDTVDLLCKRTHPDLIFYDPSLDDGLYLIERQKAANHGPILACYTSDARFAVDAFEAGAVHYLLPTSDVIAIETALDRAARRIERRGESNSYLARPLSSPLLLRENVVARESVLRDPASHMAKVIALPLQNGIDIRPCEEIVHVHGEGSYARVVFQRDPAVLVSRSIGDCEETLHDRGFLRVHRSHLVNLMHVRRVLRGKQHRLCMSNGDEVEVSERHRDELMEHLNVIGRKRR